LAPAACTRAKQSKNAKNKKFAARFIFLFGDGMTTTQP
jgi:hypothetical protein